MGTEALYKATELKPDVILLDLSMPGINGIETAVFIHEEVPQAEILVVTEHDSRTFCHLPKLTWSSWIRREIPNGAGPDTGHRSREQPHQLGKTGHNRSKGRSLRNMGTQRRNPHLPKCE